MGAVKVDIYKSERPFELITFSDVDCVKALIKNRSIIDPYYGSEQDSYFDHAGNVHPLNQELIVIYADLDGYIERARLNVKQRYIVKKLMQGYTEEELAIEFNRDVRNIYQNLDKIAQKIKQINDREWLYDYIYLNKVRVRWNYKQCGKCKCFKPVLNEFFSINKRSPDGFNSVCKECR